MISASIASPKIGGAHNTDDRKQKHAKSETNRKISNKAFDKLRIRRYNNLANEV